jgi:hypothetical protein
VADYYFHYTSRVAAQMVFAAGRLRGSAQRPVYLADTLFRTTSEAASRLGIPVAGPAVNLQSGFLQLTKPIDIVCAVPASRLNPVMLSSREAVAQFRDWSTREVIYAGGGEQFRYLDSIDIRGLPWLTLLSP